MIVLFINCCRFEKSFYGSFKRKNNFLDTNWCDVTQTKLFKKYKLQPQVTTWQYDLFSCFHFCFSTLMIEFIKQHKKNLIKSYAQYFTPTQSNFKYITIVKHILPEALRYALRRSWISCWCWQTISILFRCSVTVRRNDLFFSIFVSSCVHEPKTAWGFF